MFRSSRNDFRQNIYLKFTIDKVASSLEFYEKYLEFSEILLEFFEKFA